MDVMKPWFVATEPFDPRDGAKWQKYIEWSGLTQLVELFSLDPILCPPVLDDVKDEYWPHIVNEDFMLAFFLDADFLRQQVANIQHKNLLCVFRNPSEPPIPPDGSFEFAGYDLVDVQHSASALTNCGGFPDVFSNSELSTIGLLPNFNRAVEVQTLLRQRHPEEHHAKCHLWAIFRERPSAMAK
jgi:hypothetical protein